MGNKQSTTTPRRTSFDAARRHATIQPIDANSFVPPSNTLSSLSATQAKQYAFSIPKNGVWTNIESRINGDLGDRKFVAVDSTRCLLVHKQKTEAILVRNHKTNTIHICSFAPPGKHHKDDIPLFEWGKIEKKRRYGYKLKTPYDGSFFVRDVHCKGDADNNENKNKSNARTIVVTSSKHNDRICARFEETDTTWECTTLYGIDPAMMVCFVVGLDTLRMSNCEKRGSIICIGFNKSSKDQHSNQRSTERTKSGSTSKRQITPSTGSSTMSRGTRELPTITSFINARAA